MVKMKRKKKFTITGDRSWLGKLDSIGEKLSYQYPDRTTADIFFELAQQMLDSGMSQEDIVNRLRIYYGANENEIAHLQDEFFDKSQLPQLEIGNIVEDEK